MTVGYTAEVERTRRSQGLEAELPVEQRQAVAALLAAAVIQRRVTS